MKFLFVKSHSRCVLSLFIAIIPTLFINLIFCYPPAKPPSNPKLSPYSPTMEQELKRFGKAVAISDGDEEESYVIPSDTCCRDMRSKKGVLCQPEKDVNECSPSTQLDADEITEEESDNSGASKYFRRGRKLEKELSYPAIPQLRRKRIPWTTAEEETLKGSSGSSPFSRSRRSLQWIRTNHIGGTLRSGSQRQLSPVFGTRGGSSVLSSKLAGLQSTVRNMANSLRNLQYFRRKAQQSAERERERQR